MNILNLEHISKLFGDKMIFDDASFGVQEGDKVGIIGINGIPEAIVAGVLVAIVGRILIKGRFAAPR